MTQTTVFQSGNSQAVRLPKEFRFKSKTVVIFRRADVVVLREKPHASKELFASWPPVFGEDLASLDAMMGAIDAPEAPDRSGRKPRVLCDKPGARHLAATPAERRKR